MNTARHNQLAGFPAFGMRQFASFRLAAGAKETDDLILAETERAAEELRREKAASVRPAYIGQTILAGVEPES